jgi:hypothetical protein
MTINSLSSVASTVVGGLGTQTYNVVTAGLYTISFKAFLPYLASGGQAQSVVPSAASTNVTCAADTAGNKNSTYWTFNSAGDLYGYYVWYNINSAGVDPAPAGRTGIEVDGATGATAATLATATITAINASSAASYVTATAGTSGHLIITNVQPGTCTDAANGTASYGASFSVTAGSYGTPAMSGLDVVIKNNSTVLGRYGFPSPTQPILGGSVTVNAAANDVITVVLSSLSTADSALNAVKTIVNIFQGE